MDKQFLNYIHWFRAIAILMVVFSHVIPFIEWNHNSIRYASKAFFSGGTFLFVFISGYLFEHLKNSFEIRKYYLSKLRNVICPYILISIPAIAMYILNFKTDHRWILTPDFNELPVFSKVIKFYITGAHLGPLWYIPMAVLLFLVSPLLLKTLTNGYLKGTILIITFLVFIYIPRPSLNENAIQAFMHYLFVYYLGMLFSSYKEVINPLLYKSKVRLVLAISFVLFFGLAFLKMPWMMFLQKLLFIILTISIFLHFEKIKKWKVLNIIAKYSFGIYFIHGYLIAILNKIDINFSGWFQFLFVSIATLIVSLALVYLTTKALGKRSKYIIGS